MKVRKSITLQIPKPCSKDWDKMLPLDAGRFCQNCNRTVIDLSHYSDGQLRDYLTSNPGKICGQLSPYQINREILCETAVKRKSFLPQLFLSIALYLGFNNDLESGTKSFAQPQLTLNDKKDRFPLLFSAQEKVPADSLNYVYGTIRDKQTKAPLQFVSVRIQMNDSIIGGGASDTNGKFKVFIPGKLINQELLLGVLYLGYENEELKFSAKKLPFEMKIDLEASNILLGEIIRTDK